MKPNIDNYNDIMDFLDNQIQYVSWNTASWDITIFHVVYSQFACRRK